MTPTPTQTFQLNPKYLQYTITVSPTPSSLYYTQWGQNIAYILFGVIFVIYVIYLIFQSFRKSRQLAKQGSGPKKQDQNSKSASWYLEDVEEVAKTHPDTFFIPP